MKLSAYDDRLVHVMGELVKFTLLARGRSGHVIDRCSERKGQGAGQPGEAQPAAARAP